MSNNTNDWTYNALWVTTVASDLEDLHSLDQLIREMQDDDDGSAISFFQHIPIPQCLIDTCGYESTIDEDNNEKSCGYRYLHDFTTTEWGCAFDAHDPKLAYCDDETAYYEFKTLHNPPLAWLAEVSSQFPKLMFELEATNELDLWDSFSVTYLGGQQIDHKFDKKQPKQNNK
jgi:hypothetical protein